jgi:hypothetical protein
MRGGLVGKKMLKNEYKFLTMNLAVRDHISRLTLKNKDYGNMKYS